MIELVFWFFAIYILFKGVGLFLRYFIPAARDTNQTKKQYKTESKFKDAEEVDFIEIKNDTKSEKENS